jgi:hypothetical protein
MIVIGITGYILHLTHRYKERLTCITAMMIAMTTGMMSSLMVGTVLGIISGGQLEVPTISAVVAGMVVGYFIGRPISLMAALDGLIAGIMGGMMGAMLGVMVINPVKMVGFMALIYAIVMFVLIRLIREEIGMYKKEKLPARTSQHL